MADGECRRCADVTLHYGVILHALHDELKVAQVVPRFVGDSSPTTLDRLMEAMIDRLNDLHSNCGIDITSPYWNLEEVGMAIEKRDFEKAEGALHALDKVVYQEASKTVAERDK